MGHIRKVTDVITFPARTAVGAARLGIKTTGQVLGWAAEQVVGHMTAPPAGQGPAATRPVSAEPVSAEPDVAEPDDPGIDPMLGTRTPPAAAAAKKAAPRKKVPAGQVPLKSAPTPALTPALESFESDDEPAAPAAKKAPATKAAAKKTPTKKGAAKKTPATKAPSKKAAVLAPALGLSESEVAETEAPLLDPSTAGSVVSETETLRQASDADRG